jgi:hypothetical protein
MSTKRDIENAIRAQKLRMQEVGEIVVPMGLRRDCRGDAIIEISPDVSVPKNLWVTWRKATERRHAPYVNDWEDAVAILYHVWSVWQGVERELTAHRTFLRYYSEEAEKYRAAGVSVPRMSPPERSKYKRTVIRERAVWHEALRLKGRYRMTLMIVRLSGRITKRLADAYDEVLDSGACAEWGGMPKEIARLDGLISILSKDKAESKLPLDW